MEIDTNFHSINARQPIPWMRSGWLLGLLACALTTTFAAESSTTNASQTETKKTSKALSRAVTAWPDATPERILLTLTAEPATSQAVSWRTRPTTNLLQGAIVRASSGPIEEKTAILVPAVVEQVVYGGGQTMLHASVEFTNLQPSTLYAYRLGDGKTWSEWNQFRTAARDPEPFRFLYLGDLQTGISSQGSRVLRGALLTAPDARFIVQTGDLVTDPLDDQLWHEWYAAAGWMYRVIPSFPTPGNHDLNNQALDKTWRPQFALPHNGPAGQAELAFYTDYQGARLISFNGNAYTNSDQLAWLESALRVPAGTWKIVVTHQPLYSTGQKRDASNRRKLLEPLFDRAGVDIVLQGHDHSYGRTGKIRDGKTVGAEEAGVVYTASVSGSKMYKLNRATRPLMVRLAANVQLFQVVSVTREALNYEAFTADGSRFDAFELRRNGSHPTRLIDRAPKDAHPREEDFYAK